MSRIWMPTTYCPPPMSTPIAWVMAHICTSHVTQMYETCHTHECDLTTVLPTCQHLRHESCHTYVRVMSHKCVSHVTHMNASWLTVLPRCKYLWNNPCHTCVWAHMNESCHTSEWVMSHVWMSHVTHLNESCHMYEWVMSHMRMSIVTHMYESWHTYEWAWLSILPSCQCVWMSHVTHIYESCHRCTWVMSHIWMSHELRSFPNVDTRGLSTWHTNEWLMIHVTQCTHPQNSLSRNRRTNVVDHEFCFRIAFSQN